MRALFKNLINNKYERWDVPGAIPIFGLMFQSLLKKDFHNSSSLETLYQVWETVESFSMSLKHQEKEI